MDSGNHGESVQSQPQATLCASGCGFFANVGTSGMCSKCFREAEKAQAQAHSVASAVEARAVSRATSQQQEAAPVPVAAPETPSEPESTTVTENSVMGSSPPLPPPCNPSRCNVKTCRKKLGLTGFKCRCGYSFCGQHRYAEAHDCTFDYKTFGRMKIDEANPLVQASKIQKI